MQGQANSWPIRGLLGATLFALAYGGLALFALATTQTASGTAVIWPSSGVLLAGLLLLPASARWPLSLMVAAASVIANTAYGTPFWIAAGFTVANLIEGHLAAHIGRGDLPGHVRLDDPRRVARFFFGALIAAAVSATVATVTLGVGAGANGIGLAFFASWFSTVLLGMLIVAPAIIALRHGLRQRRREPDLLRNALIVYVLGGAAVAAAFFQSDYPLLFLPLAMTVVATYLMGMAGAVGMILMVAVVGSLTLMNGAGATLMVADAERAVYFFQLYLLTLFLSALPLATLLTKSRLQAEEILRRTARLEAAEEFAEIGHWRYDLRSREMVWSEQMFRIYGLDPAVDTPRDVDTGGVYEDDVARLKAALRGVRKSDRPFMMQIRIPHKDGGSRVIDVHGHLERDEDGPAAVFGVIKDVTDQALAMEQVSAAHQVAEQRAREAQALSETDQLTGVANRRKLLACLREEMGRAEHRDAPLSIVMLDVDHFKAINDTYGHAVGDEVLQRIADVTTKCLGEADVFGRLGGEEFLAILPDTGCKAAAEMAECIRLGVHALANESDLGVDSVSVSLGVAEFQHGADESWFLQAADGALYQSKNEGRNRLSVAS